MTAAREAELRAQLTKIEEARRLVLNEARAEAQAELEALRQEVAQARSRLERTAPSQHERFLAEAERVLQERLSVEQPLPERVETAPTVPTGPLRVGDIVWVHSLQASGQVQSLPNEREVEVQVGAFHLKAPRSGVELRERPQSMHSPDIRVGASPASSPGIELDLRGMRVEAALEDLDRYLDQAYLATLPWVRIIHGKGTGALRQVVREALRSHPIIANFRSGEQGEGGEGVTIAYFVGQ